MDKCQNLNHTKWECKYHVVFIPQCCRRTLYEELRQYLEKYFANWPSKKTAVLKKGI